MVRTSDEPDAPFVLLSAFPSGELQLATRATKGASASGKESTTDWKFGHRLRLVRQGETVLAEYELPTGWKPLGKVSIVGNSLRVGVVSLSHKNDRLTRASYGQLRLTPKA
jgi:hypothetical protein